LPALRVIGPGRAGRSLMAAVQAAGWDVRSPLGRGDDIRAAAAGVDLLVISTPDGAIADVAAAVDPVPSTVVAHLAGALGVDVLVPHERRAALHPLVALPEARLGAERLRGAWFATAGDLFIDTVVAALGGRAIAVADEDRASYHAAAAIASNHLVALLGQVERVAAQAGVPLAAYLDLVRATVENVAALGPAGALTGPVARGDWTTVAGHLDAIPEEECPAYRVMVEQAERLLDQRSPNPFFEGSSPNAGSALQRMGESGAKR
jgi:predicted short-subunit dehydrogenase-like oxidoreductase (DUF2520 family)